MDLSNYHTAKCHLMHDKGFIYILPKQAKLMSFGELYIAARMISELVRDKKHSRFVTRVRSNHYT